MDESTIATVVSSLRWIGALTAINSLCLGFVGACVMFLGRRTGRVEAMIDRMLLQRDR